MAGLIQEKLEEMNQATLEHTVYRSFNYHVFETL